MVMANVVNAQNTRIADHVILISIDGFDPVGTGILYLVSALVLVIVAILGIYGAITRKKGPLGIVLYVPFRH